ncbi:MAG: TPM domain-containing protein [Catonella sp.]
MRKNIICKKVCFLVMVLMLLLSFAGNFGFSIEKAYAGDVTSRIVDDADVLTDEEEAKLRAKLDEISERQKFDVVINTINGGNYSSIVDYADDYFDYNRFSDSASKLNDGVVLVMDYGSRDFYISTSGKGIKVITDEKRESMQDEFLPYLSEGNAYKGFETFAELCDKAVSQYDSKKFMITLAGSIIPALILALIVCSILTSQLKTVREQHMANNYAVKDSFYVRDAQDFFLYKNVTRTKIEKSSSSGSSTHTSSSGNTHGGGGGKF